MIDGSLRRTAEQFWSAARVPRTFPCELERAVAWALPLAVLRIPNLWVHDVERYLHSRQLPSLSYGEDRPLHGCVYAHRGKGLILVDGTDEKTELMFTIAHELAHFLLDYHVPRSKAVERLGPRITDVLDGLRPAEVHERVDAALSGISLGVFSHFMYRSGVPNGSSILASENRADRLALELLAPEETIRRSLVRGFYDKPFEKRVSSLRRLLKTRFGLPSSVAETVAARLCRGWFGGPSAREWLGL